MATPIEHEINEHAEAETTVEHTVEEAHAEEGGIAGVIGTFGLRGDLFAAQLVNFLLVMLVLWKFVYKPILKVLAEREARIEKSVKDAEAVALRLQEAEKEKAEVLRAARQEADAFATKAAADTEARKMEMVEAAKREVERVIASGKLQLESERQAMMAAMRKEIVEIAVAAATKIVGEGMTEKKSTSLAEEVVRKMT